MAYLVLSCTILLGVLLLPYLSMANITLGSSLSATGDNSSWPSPSGDFAFGFYALNNSDDFLLAIWFDKIPETIVWHANNRSDDDYKPVGPVPRGSRLDLTAAGLELKDPRGNTIWYAKPNATVSDAAMLDTGNFVLTGNGSGSAYAWESFKNPTDTILPTQTLDSGSKMFSKLTQTNFSKGRFLLQFSDGNLLLSPVAWPSDSAYRAYYNSSTVDSSEFGTQLVFNKSANIYIEKNNGDIVPLPWKSLEIPGVEQYYRATLDFDGVFRQYAYDKSPDANHSWLSSSQFPNNICTAMDGTGSEIGSGACGFNSYCKIQSGKHSCECPVDYVLVDPNNIFAGCKPNFSQSCEPDDDGSRNPEELFELRELTVSVNWPRGDYEMLEPYSHSKCKESCLHDCSCAVVVVNSKQCWKKKLPLSNGIETSSNGMETNERSTIVLYKVRKGNSSSTGFPDNPGRSKKEKSNFLLGAFLLGGFAIANLVLLALIVFLIVFVWHKRKDDHDKCCAVENKKRFPAETEYNAEITSKQI